MTKPNDGGPAFPVPNARGVDAINKPFTLLGSQGMTLRQWYAGQAMQGLIAADAAGQISVDVKYAWQYADQMLAAEIQIIPLAQPDPSDQLYADQERIIDGLREAITRLVHGKASATLSVKGCLEALANREQILKRDIGRLAEVILAYRKKLNMPVQLGQMDEFVSMVRLAEQMQEAIQEDSPEAHDAR